CMEGTQLWTF
nr:immunoglobulin light chain junction region [Macaca mulatta]